MCVGDTLKRLTLNPRVPSLTLPRLNFGMGSGRWLPRRKVRCQWYGI